MPVCPECEADKHPNCAGFAYDENDVEVPCMCPCREDGNYVGKPPEDRMVAFGQRQESLEE